jgi:hypothetical protein
MKQAAEKVVPSEASARVEKAASSRRTPKTAAWAGGGNADWVIKGLCAQGAVGKEVGQR